VFDMYVKNLLEIVAVVIVLGAIFSVCGLQLRED